MLLIMFKPKLYINNPSSLTISMALLNTVIFKFVKV